MGPGSIGFHVADLDGPVHYAEFGGAGTPIVLLHGLGGSWLNWRAVAPRLARGHRVLAPDLPGFGRSPIAGRSGSMAAQQALVARFIGSVAGAPAIVVGNSMGGLIALMLAAADPTAVSGLVLVGPAQPSPFGAPIDVEVWAAFAAYATPWLGPWYVKRRMARLGPEGLVSEMLRICCVDPARVDPELRAAHVALAAERLARAPRESAAFVEAARSVLSELRHRRAFTAMVERISAPALLIHGAGDRLVPMVASEALARLRPDWAFERLDGVGHVPQLEAPDRFAAVVDRWLERHRLASRRARPV